MIESDFLSSDRGTSISLVLIIIVFTFLAALLTRSLDTTRPPPDPNIIDENLYVNGKTARRMSLGFNGLLADWYWMRSLQYVGGKIVKVPDSVPIDNLQDLNLKLLAPLLDAATTLDPEFYDPYEYAAVVLPSIDVDGAIRITQKGIDANPTSWRLYQHLGYIYWQKHEYQTAAEIYGRGAKIAGAPPWMEAMKAKMAVEGGSRNTAREIYGRMFEQANDERVKDMARRRLLQVNALDQIDALHKLLATYQQRSGHCPANWQELAPIFRALRLPIDQSGAPLDPSGTPYLFGNTNCEVQLNPKSEIPIR